MFALLSDGKLDAYLAHRLLPEEVLINLHVPKTAGSSLTADMPRLLGPFMNLWPEDVDFSRPWPERQRLMLARFLARAGSGYLSSVTGHCTLAMTAEALRAAPQPLPFVPAYVSMLRDPVTRVVSDYAYTTSPAHPAHAERRKSFPTLEAYIDAPDQQNKMATYLLADPDMPEDAIPGFLDRTYRFLGTLEEYEMSSFLLFALAGQRHVSTKRRRVAPGGPTLRSAIDPALVARIAAVNRLDALIHRHVSGVLARIQPAYGALRLPGSASARPSAPR
jgi:hypothetical protein